MCICYVLKNRNIISLIIILTACLLIYGFVTFSDNAKVQNKKSVVDFLNSKGWSQFTSGFITGGFGGASIAYILLKFIILLFYQSIYL